MNKDNAEAQVSTRKNKWTMAHSYYAITGGIALDVNGSAPFYSRACTPTLTENGVLFLLKTDPDLLPDIPESDIKDMSRHKSLTRFIAGIQATWFCVSCLVRVGQQLPLSLLELHTFIHAICTITVYFIWLKKPLGIKRQLLITSDRMRPLLAYMWMASHTSARRYTDEDIKDTEHYHAYSQAPEFEAISLGEFCEDGRTPSEGSSVNVPARDESETVIVSPEHGLANTSFYAKKSSARWTVKVTTITTEDGPPEETTTRQDPAIFVLTMDDARRWRLASEAMGTYALQKPNVDKGFVTTYSVPEMIDSAPSEWTENDPVANLKSLFAQLGLCILASAIGTLYALAWNTRFPGRDQRVWWRITSLVVACSAGLALIIVTVLILGSLSLFFLEKRQAHSDSITQPTTIELQSNSTSARGLQSSHPSKRLEFFESSFFERSKWKVLGFLVQGLGKIITFPIVYIWCLLYMVSRAYLVGESFRMVFYLPPDTFQATPWENYFPHIG
jgi:hypothetical protein